MRTEKKAARKKQKKWNQSERTKKSSNCISNSRKWYIYRLEHAEPCAFWMMQNHIAFIMENKRPETIW